MRAPDEPTLETTPGPTPSLAFGGNRVLARVRRSQTLSQSLAFAASGGIAGIAAAATAALIARNLSRSDYGSFTFSTSFLTLAALFFEIGLFLPMGRLAAIATGRERRAVEGAALATFAPIALAFSLVVVGASFLVDPIFHVHSGAALRIAAPLAFVYPFSQFSLLLTQGDGRLHLYSVWTAVSQVLYLGLIVFATSVFGLHHPSTPLLLRGAAFACGAIGLMCKLRPVFDHVRGHARRFVTNARQWGFQAFIGRVLGIGTYNMDVLMLAALTHPGVVALYSVAGTLANGCGLPITGLGSALFSRAVHQDRLQGRWLAIAWLFGLGCVIPMWLLAHPIIVLIFSDRYGGASALLAPLVLAQAVRGVTTLYNTFLGAHGKGLELRHTAVILTVSNVIFNVGLIPPFGALGAAWASFLALVVNLGAHIYYYRRVAGGSGVRTDAGVS
jgi:O-antigen/teichoic acid export membrane protein